MGTASRGMNSTAWIQSSLRDSPSPEGTTETQARQFIGGQKTNNGGAFVMLFFTSWCHDCSRCNKFERRQYQNFNIQNSIFSILYSKHKYSLTFRDSPHRPASTRKVSYPVTCSVRRIRQLTEKADNLHPAPRNPLHVIGK